MTDRPVATALAGAVVIDARVAGQLAVMLRAARREAARNGLALSADLAEVLAVVEQAAEVPAPVPPVVPILAPRGSAVTDSAATPILLGVDEVARLAGVTPRAIRKAALRGRLVGRLVGGRWEFTEQAVTMWRGRRDGVAHA